MIKGYKVFNPDWKCRDMQYTCPGRFKKDVMPEVCMRGLHFCIKAASCFNYYPFRKENHVCEVIAHGNIDKEGEKYCTNDLEIVRELEWEEVLSLVNIGDHNEGYGNIGSSNKGNNNVGCFNTGNMNTGHYNSGRGNTGSNNPGSSNTGYGNEGSRNTGDTNIGRYNAGDENIGDWNTGDHNIGCGNTGDFNLGSYNTGDWNIASHSCGCFNTQEIEIYMFDRPSGMRYTEWRESEAYKVLSWIIYEGLSLLPVDDMTEEEKYKYMDTGLRHREFFIRNLDTCKNIQERWDMLPKVKKEIVKDIPNFDPDIFEQCTGIKVN